MAREWVGGLTNPVWRVRLTNGLSSVAVSGGRVFTQVARRIGGVNREVCLALNAANGVELWATALDTASYPGGGVGFDDGPRSTPSAAGGSVFVLTSYLILHRLNATNGAVDWSVNLVSAYGASGIEWQNAASPLVDGGLIYLNANCGADSLLALRTADGSLAWRSQEEALTHSTPVLAEIDGVRQLIFAAQSGLVAVNPETGDRFWSFPYPFGYSTSLAVSPVVYEDMVFVSGAHSYGMGSVAVRARRSNDVWTATRLWSANNPASHWMTPVCHQGFLYGQFGIQTYDSPSAQLKCIDLRTGAVKWSTNGFGRGGTILVDNLLVTLTEMGEVVLSRPATNAYTELGRFRAITNYHANSNKCWNVPAFSDGRLYARSSAQAACFDLSLPGLSLDPLEVAAGQPWAFTVRTVNGSPLSSNRVAGLAVRAASDPTTPLGLWTALTNKFRWINGAARIEGLDPGTEGRRFFFVDEP